MRRLLGLAALPVVALALLLAADKEEKKCPISGQPAKAEHSLNVNGEMVSFCCDKCPTAYKKQIGLKDDGPGKCPVSGEAAKKEQLVIEKTAEKVYFCCNNCPKKFASE